MWAVMISPATSSTHSTPRFHLCAGNLQSSEITPSSDGLGTYVLNIQLDATGMDEFAAFTRAHVGKMVQIVSGDTTVVEAVVRAEIASGLVQASMIDEDRVAQIAALLENPPASPCGATVSHED